MAAFASPWLAPFTSKPLGQRCSLSIHSSIFATTVHLLPRDLRMIRNIGSVMERSRTSGSTIWERSRQTLLMVQPCFISMVIEHFYSNRRGKWPEHLTSTKGFKYLALEGRICYEYHRGSAEPLHPWWMAPAARLLKYKLPVTVLVSGVETWRGKMLVPGPAVGVRRSRSQQSSLMCGTWQRKLFCRTVASATVQALSLCCDYCSDADYPWQSLCQNLLKRKNTNKLQRASLFCDVRYFAMGLCIKSY